MEVRAAADGGVQLKRGGALVFPLIPVALNDGITAWIDPLDPSLPFRVDAREPDAGPAIEELLGPDAADAARRAYWSLLRGEEHGGETIDAQRTPIGEDAGRLGFLLWWEQNAVTPLAQVNLDLEIAIVAARLADLGAVELAQERFVRAVPQLRRVAEAIRDDADAPAVADTIDEGLGSYLSVCGYDLPGPVLDDLEALRSAVSAVAALEAAGSSMVSDDELTELLEAFSRAGATRSGGASSPLAYSVDWENVPRGLLDPSEDTITADWGKDASRLDVAVLPAAHAPRVRDLVFRVQREGENRPSAGGSLAFDPERGLYAGSCALDAPLGVGDRVDVAALDWTSPVALGVEATQRRARRSAAWAVSFERLAASADGISQAALGAGHRAWYEASDLFGTGNPASERCAERARALEAVLADPEAWLARLSAPTLAERMLASHRA